MIVFDQELDDLFEGVQFQVLGGIGVAFPIQLGGIGIECLAIDFVPVFQPLLVGERQELVEHGPIALGGGGAWSAGDRWPSYVFFIQLAAICQCHQLRLFGLEQAAIGKPMLDGEIQVQIIQVAQGFCPIPGAQRPTTE